MKSLDKIPTGKVERATKLVKTGVKIGGNYVKYYGEKLVNPSVTKDKLNENNAADIYDGLKSLKGSALKVAQMLSMEKNILPSAYVEKFSLSQFSVPPLSAPLVRKTFKKYLNKYPEDIFDHFEKDSINAASIGQVHKAEKDGKKLAVKVQYPGVAESISSDLAIVKPVAIKMFNLQGKDSDKYFKEVEEKLIEETNYILEVKQSKEITEACKKIPNLTFPEYYEELSSERIITMDWMEGIHLSEFTAKPFSEDIGNTLGQTLWDFYMYQIHGLKKVHADPHPGNFLVSANKELIVIDFGCIKEVPDSFYIPYFELAQQEVFENDELFMQKMYELEILRVEDSPEELAFFKALFKEMLGIFTSPFNKEEFDFGSDEFWGAIADLSERYSSDPTIRKMNGNRGSKHFLYMNRTFFGLYNLLHDLKAKISVNHFRQYV
ncbi:ABC transporter [Neptunitalea chrysea]|uniref:ABC transporter n=1 Tax=Neptunitalea chrysea TaxID=1647581 RepID=A0A9W6B7G6_9FLAO|nr:AarF/UbiB family protein [Neptunitalea chrysea]GLB53222.1 ABC transporter [Neptunitalea chrysea]